MIFTMQGLEIDTDKVKDKQKLGDILLYLAREYYKDIDVTGARYDYDEKENVVKIYFKRKTKYYMLSNVIKDIDAKLITGLPEECFYPNLKKKDCFMLLGYADGYYIGEEDIKNEFQRCQVKEGVKDVRFYTGENTLMISVIGG